MGLTVTAVTDYYRVLVTVVSSPTITAPLVLSRVHADGTQHAVITPDLIPQLVGGSAIVADYHCPVNQVITYTATAGAQSGTSGPAFIAADVLTLVHPTNPDLSVTPDKVAAITGRGNASTAVGFQVLDQELLVHERDAPRSGEAGTLAIKVVTEAAEVAVRALFADGGPILVNGVFRDLRWLWIQPGNLSWDNPATFDAFKYRYLTIPYVATTQPDIAADPSFTCDELAATGWTCTQAASHYADCNGMSLDIRIA